MTRHRSAQGFSAGVLVVLLVAAPVLTVVALLPADAEAAPKTTVPRGLQTVAIPPGAFHADGEGVG